MIRISLTAADGRAVEIHTEDEPAPGLDEVAATARELIADLAAGPPPRPTGFAVDSTIERSEES